MTDYETIRNSNSYKKIKQDLIDIGIKEDDTVLCHSSLSSMGFVEHGAITFLLALCDLLSKNGTVLFPSFTYIEANQTFEFDYHKSKVCVGLIPETFRNMPGVKRSIHPTHSVCAIGKNADEIIKNHWLDDTPLGKNSPFQLLTNYNGKLLFVGCGLYCNSFIHRIEEVANVPYALGDYKTYKLFDSNQTLTYKSYRVHNFNRENGVIVQRYDKTLSVLDSLDYRQGKIHGANSYVINSVELYEKATKKLKEDPFYFVDDPDGLYKNK